MSTDQWTAYGETLDSRLLLGTALYPSPDVMSESIQASGTQIVTLSLRRQSPQEEGGRAIWDHIQKSGCKLLPNTAGCHSAEEAISTAHMARELLGTHWLKLEVIGDDYNLQPDPFELVEAARQLIRDGFAVFPYCTDDLVLCRKLLDVGCELLMPWGAPIGTGQGLSDPRALETLRERLPDVPLIVDAGLGRPSHATQAMEMGYDAVLLNTAVARADDPVQMATAFRQGVEAGRNAWLAGIMPERQVAHASTPVVGTPFWHQDGGQ